jgi:hypothetical protein
MRMYDLRNDPVCSAPSDERLSRRCSNEAGLRRGANDGKAPVFEGSGLFWPSTDWYWLRGR